MLPVHLNSDGSIHPVSNHSGTARPMPNLCISPDIPRSSTELIMPDMSVVDVTQFTFYCNSVRKSGMDTAEDVRNPEVDYSGAGTLESPWTDLNNALIQVSKLSQYGWDRASFKIVLTGEVNYAIGSDNMVHNGYGLVVVDCSDAVFDVSITDTTTSYAHLFRYLCGITFDGINSISLDWEAVGHSKLTMISDCSHCRFNIGSILASMEGVSGHTLDPSSTIIYGCVSCAFKCDSASVTIKYRPSGGASSEPSYHTFAGSNTSCSFQSIAVSFDMHKITESSAPTYIRCNGFSENVDCIYSNCSANSLTVVNNSSERLFQISGCGWHDNAGSLWVGDNIGYCRYYSVGRLVYNTSCTINADCGVDLEDRPSSEPPSSSDAPPPSEESSEESSEEPPPSEESSPEEPPSSSSSGGVSHKGSILCHAFTRSVKYRLFALSYETHTDECKADYYVLNITFNREHVPCSDYQGSGTAYPNRKFSEISRNYGKLITVDGEPSVWEDENGDTVYDCEVYEEIFCDEDGFKIYDYENDKDIVLMSDTSSVASAGTADINKLIDGTLYSVPEFTDIPIDKSGWTGFNNYYRCGSLYHISPHTLNKNGDTLTVNTKTEADYYSNWGEYPCANGDGWGIITLDTYVFEWRPDDDNDTQKPKYLILEDVDGNEIRCEFMKEYCLQGNTDVDRDMLALTTCNQISGLPDDNVRCNYVVVKGTTKLYDLTQNGVGSGWEGYDYPRPTRTLSRTYKYKGVEF